MKNYRAELTGVFGDPVDDNPTGAVEEAAYNALGLNYRYITVRVLPEDLETAMQSVRAFGMKGINLTMPHKIKVIPMLDALSEAASIIGAVNTVVNRDGKLFGENTDGKGFVYSLADDGVALTGKNVALLGAGGAARAIAVECALAGAKRITVINRSAERGGDLAALIDQETEAEGVFLSWLPGMVVPAGTDILINGTPVGLKPDDQLRPDIDYESITPEMHVCDVVFNPEIPLFLEAAKSRGAVIHTGLGMLVRQAAINFTLWTGEEAPLAEMKEALKKEFE